MIGGSACPRAMIETFENVYGVEVCHAWGMTEMSPLGSLCSLKPEYADLDGEERLDIKVKQGHAPFGVEMKITDDDDQELPWDGKTFGRLKVRGPAVAASYFKEDGARSSTRTASSTPATSRTIDPHGYMQITDRAKDVIKSGGEWISSIDLENLAVGHPKVAEAAVIGIAPSEMGRAAAAGRRAQEGPDRQPSDDILDFMQGKIAKWWMPDDVVFVDEIPHTATGKILKTGAARAVQGLRAADGGGCGVTVVAPSFRARTQRASPESRANFCVCDWIPGPRFAHPE